MRFASERSVSRFPDAYVAARSKPVREVRVMYRGLHRHQMDPGPEFSFFAIPRRSSRRRPPWWKIRISLGIVAWHSVFTENGAPRELLTRRLQSIRIVFLPLLAPFFLFSFFDYQALRWISGWSLRSIRETHDSRGGRIRGIFKLDPDATLILDDMDIPRSLIS